LVVRAAPAIERLGAALSFPLGGVYIVEAVKQVYRPVDSRLAKKPRVVPLSPAVASIARCSDLPAG
jgi:hypothetical protein